MTNPGLPDLVRSPTSPGRRAQRTVAGVPLRLLLVLGALSAFGPISMDLYLPALPRLADALGTSASASQLTMTSCMVGLALGQLVTGPVTDAYGRRTPVLVGLAVFAAASLLCALSTDILVLVALRFIQGAAGGAAIVIARAAVRDRYDTEAAAQVFSLLVVVTAVAPVVAPIVGGQLLRWTTWPGLFNALAVIGVLLLALTARSLPESLPVGARTSGGRTALRSHAAILLRDGDFLGFTAVLALGCGILFAYIIMSPFVLQGAYELDAQTFAVVFAVNSAGLLAVGRWGAILVARRGAAATLRRGLVIGGVGSAALLVAVASGAGLVVLLPILFLTVSSVSLVMPTATALGLAHHGDRAGTAGGVMGLAQFGLSGAIVPLVSINGTNPVLMALTMTGSGTLALLVGTLLLARRRRTEKSR
ncbi:multidrug effflux MFS transporter [Klenkia sp. LSe6-5]|uniref:Multidrug effflux MFS transporter n=1 Tax=Klenkia sesuvii TaxID=3103137 RepID=A0ABU8DR58_9ACTN